jgi:outer membrane protein
MLWPLLAYEGKYAYIRGFTAGVKLINLEVLEFSIFAGYDDTSFDSSDSSDSRLRRLKDRHPGITAGTEARLVTPYVLLHASAERNISGQSNGLIATVGGLTSLEFGAMEFIPTFGIRWNDGEYNDYYYGVSGKEARKSGLDEYRAGSGFSPYFGLTMDYSLTENWEIICGWELAFLSDTVKNSPMTGADHVQNLTLGVSYTF